MSLVDAIKAGDLAGVKELLARDPHVANERTPEGVSCVAVAMYHGKRDIARLLADGRTDLDLYEACTVGSVDQVRELIEKNPAQVNSFSPDGFPPVALAAYFGHPEIVEMLIAVRGGRECSGDERDEGGRDSRCCLRARRSMCRDSPAERSRSESPATAGIYSDAGGRCEWRSGDHPIIEGA